MIAMIPRSYRTRSFFDVGPFRLDALRCGCCRIQIFKNWNCINFDNHLTLESMNKRRKSQAWVINTKKNYVTAMTKNTSNIRLRFDDYILKTKQYRVKLNFLSDRLISVVKRKPLLLVDEVIADEWSRYAPKSWQALCAGLWDLAPCREFLPWIHGLTKQHVCIAWTKQTLIL